MNIASILRQPWAITPQMFEVLTAISARHTAGEKLSEEQLRAAVGSDPRGSVQAGYTVENGVAVIPVQGVLAKKANLFTAISGAMSTEMLVETVNEALADDTVNALLLEIDSPGGQVDGTQQIGDAVAASTKPTAAWIDGQGCSAAYWIAAQCDAIYAASDTATIGSIGVVVEHTDQSKANEADGVKVTHITSGKYKRLANADEPLSQEARDYLQEKVDYLQTLFVDAVAVGRGVTADSLLADVADGRTFYAQQALDAGLIDGILSKDQVIQQLAYDFQTQQQQPGESALGGNMKTYTEAQFSEAVAAAEERGKVAVAGVEFERGKTEGAKAAAEAARAEGQLAGAAAERERIEGIESTPLATSYPEVVKALKADGKSGKAEAALAILGAEAKSRGDKSSALVADATAIPDVAVSAAGASEAHDKTLTGKKPEMTATEVAGKIRALMADAKAKGQEMTAVQAASLVSK